GEFGHHVIAPLLCRLMAAGAVLLPQDRQHVFEEADVCRCGARLIGRQRTGAGEQSSDKNSSTTSAHEAVPGEARETGSAKQVMTWRSSRPNRGGDWVPIRSQGKRHQPSSSLTFATMPEYSHESWLTQSFLGVSAWQNGICGVED